MRPSIRPGSGYDAVRQAASSSLAPDAITYDRAKRKLLTLDDDDDDEKKATGAASAGAGGEEVDPLDAFMASLVPAKRAKGSASATAAAAAPPAAPAAATSVNAEEIDPLDAFMSSLDTKHTGRSAPASSGAAASTAAAPASAAQQRLALDEDDAHESYLASAQRRAAQKLTKLDARAAQQGVSLDSMLARGGGDSSDDDDDDDEARSAAAGGDSKKREIKALTPVDHSTVAYEPFRKNFYKEHEEIASMSAQEMADLTADFGQRLSGRKQQCVDAEGFEAPTPVQAQAIPCILSGRDVIGIAKTGSGKTAAFVWPMVVHLLDQRPLSKGEGPIGLILAPTRELAEQIYAEAFKFLNPLGLRVTPVMGGMQKFEQERSLKAGTDVVVATPGRLVDLLAARACSCERITYLVLDEADRMFAMGFEQQLRSILSQIRPDRQFVLFSATFERRVEALAKTHLFNPLRIQVGSGGANKSIRQVCDVLPSAEAKFIWLRDKLPALVQAGPVLVFCATIAAVEELAKKLQVLRYTVGSLHGDHHQSHRQSILQQFKAGQLQLLVATDVAARGLDIKHLPTVVNFDLARSVDAHTHRIGRTGRAGKDGIAYTLVTPLDAKLAPMLVDSLEEAEQPVPGALVDLAGKDSLWLRGRTSAAARGGRGGGGGAAMVAAGQRGGRAYTNVPPPNLNAPSMMMPTPPFPSSMYGAQAFAQAYQPATTVAPVSGGVHPSRLAQVPGAASAAAAAAAAAVSAWPAPATPFQPQSAAPAAVYTAPSPSFAAPQVHPSRLGLVPQSAPAFLPSGLPLPPPPPPPPSSHAVTPMPGAPSSTAAPADAAPKRKSRWGP